MARISSYPKDSTIQDKDSWIGTESTNKATRNFTAEDVANYVVTSTNGVTGSGTLNTIPIFTGPTTIGDSSITQDVSGNVTAGNNLTVADDLLVQGDFEVDGSSQLDGALTVEGVSTFNDDIEVNNNATFYSISVFEDTANFQQAVTDSTGLPGTAGQILSSTGTETLWITPFTDEVYYTVKNSTGSQLLKGKAVMAVGTDGNSGHILVDEMIADGSVNPRYFLGVLAENIDNGNTGKAIHFGRLDQFNTNGQNGETWADGQVLWCDPANPGDFTITEPDGPNVKISAAFILNSSTNGKIQVRVQGNEGVKDLYDTKITSQVDGDVLVWDNTTGVWFNDSTLNVDYTAGRVGIGTTSPNEKLEVDGSVRVTGAGLDVGYENNSDNFVQIGKGRTTNGSAFIDLIGDITYPDFGLRLVRSNGGANANSSIINRGGGTLSLTSSSGSITFKTSNVERVRVNSLGNVGIGTTNPGSKLEVQGGDIEVDSSASGLILKSPDGTRYRITVANGGTLTVTAV